MNKRVTRLCLRVRGIATPLLPANVGGMFLSPVRAFWIAGRRLGVALQAAGAALSRVPVASLVVTLGL